MIEDRILLKWRPGVSRAARMSALLDHAVAWVDPGLLAEIGVEIYALPRGLAKQSVEKLMRHPNVEWCEPDGVLQAEPMALADASEWYQRKIGADVATAAGYRGAGRTVCVLDSGIKADHPFFNGRIAEGTNFVTEVSSTGTTGPGDWQDNEGHGTACASLVLAVAPDAWLYIGRVMSKNSASWSNVAKGILWGKDRAERISISIGGNSDSFTLRDAIAKSNAAGVPVFCAAGNSSSSTRQYPAATEGAIAVGATDASDNRAGFSNFGTAADPWVEIAAPGTGLLCAWIDGGYASFSGTSGSCPIVAGAHALVRDMAKLKATCVMVDAGQLGSGRVDLVRALGLVGSEPAPKPPAEEPAPLPPDGRMSKPVIEAVTATSVTFSWAAVGDVPGYTLYQGTGTWMYPFQTRPAGETRFTWTSLRPGTLYRIAVQVLGRVATRSEAVEFRTHAADAPTPPAEETWTQKSSQKVERSAWEPAQVQQSSQLVTTITTWEESNLGNKRNETVATVTTTEMRTVTLDTH